jgi:GNAT superfamily N-acetyltransferase
MTARVRQIRAGEGARLRVLRLHALADSPWAFGSTLSREEAFTDDVWQERAALSAAGEDRVTFIAEDGDRWTGMATGLMEPDGRLDLVGMFVDPIARGQRLGAAMVEAVAAWARGRGASRLHLWVTTTNEPALRLYRRTGFHPTGRTKALDHTPSLQELEMARDL